MWCCLTGLQLFYGMIEGHERFFHHQDGNSLSLSLSPPPPSLFVCGVIVYLSRDTPFPVMVSNAHAKFQKEVFKVLLVFCKPFSLDIRCKNGNVVSMRDSV